MSRVASAALVRSLDGSGLYTEERNLAIWEQVPAQLRLTEFSPRTLPDHPAFHWRLGCRPSGAALIWVASRSRWSATLPTACGG